MTDGNTTFSHISTGNFRWGAVDRLISPGPAPVPDPPLGPLENFAPQGANLPTDAQRVYHGNGFNTIFRPQNFALSPTKLPHPGTGPNDNVLELNLTSETLTFSKALGSVPNRGAQNNNADIFLNGVPYVQRIDDITLGRDKAVGIHFEPGVWLAVPKTEKPSEVASFVRMASIPHGTTINAQGVAVDPILGPPTINAVDITPFIIATGARVPPTTFPSQQSSNTDTFRLPQVLTGTAITQALITNPNSLLTARLAGQKILSTATLIVATNPPPPVALFGPLPPTAPTIGGGTDNIAFLQGDNNSNPASRPDENADAVAMSAIFWIETVEDHITLPVRKKGAAIKETIGHDDLTVTFEGIAPIDIDKPTEMTVTYTQIQYSQLVILNFTTLGWPHVSVANLVTADVTLEAKAIEAAVAAAKSTSGSPANSVAAGGR